MSDKNKNFISPYGKEFEGEADQINFWFESLNDLKNYISKIGEALEIAKKLFDNIGSNLDSVCRNYRNDLIIYKDEPSNLNNLLLNFVSLFENMGKLYSENILLRGDDMDDFVKIIITEIDLLKKNISSSTINLMNEVFETKKKCLKVQSEYIKLKSELEETHTNKKLLENDPNNVYNVTLKEKAEAKILTKIKEIHDILPKLESLSKDLENKKNSLNINMKESFELVVSCIFNNNLKIYQALFLIGKEKYELLTKIKISSYEIRKILIDVDINLNDYVERKYAIKKDILFDSIESIQISDIKNFDPNESANLINICDSLINYSNNFYNCMKVRKRSLHIFSKFILEFSKNEEIVTSAYGKINKQTIKFLSSFKFLSKGALKLHENNKNLIKFNKDLCDKMHSFLKNEVYQFTSQMTKETKSDYTNFLDKWNKRSKDLLSFKSLLLKFVGSRDNIFIKIKENRNNFNCNKIDKIKYESKLNILSEEEKKLISSFDDKALKIKNYINETMDFLKSNIKLLREKEFQRIHNVVGYLENIIKLFDKIINQDLENAKAIMTISADYDIYEDTKEIFLNYFNKFKINIYDGFFERVIKKIMKKNEKEKFSESSNLLFKKLDKNTLLNFFNNNTEISRKNIDRLSDNNSPREFTANELDKRCNDAYEEKYFQMENKLQQNEIYLENLEKNSSVENNYLEPSISPNEKFMLNNQLKSDDNLENKSFNLEKKYSSFNFVNNVVVNSGISIKNFNFKNSDNNLTTIEEENIDFIDQTKFQLINAKNPFQNIKETELKDYMEKLQKSHRSRVSITSTHTEDNEDRLNTENSEENVNIYSKSNFKNEKNLSLYDNIFPIETDEKVDDDFSCAYKNKMLIQGKLYVTNKKLVFYSWFNNKTLFGKTMLIIPLEDILKLEKQYNLKIFNNSIKIFTKKTELFFTSFVNRGACLRLINKNLEEFKKLNNIDLANIYQEEGQENLEDNRKEENLDNLNKLRRGTLDSVTTCALKSSINYKILKKIEFLSSLEKLHNQRLEEFETNKFNDIQPFKAESTFKKVYFKDEPVGNFPLPIAYLNLFHNENVCEELGRGKGFWESLYELRNDFDLTYERVTEGINSEIPKFFEDPEHALTLFSNIDEESMTNFLEEIKNWPKMVKFQFKYTHPIKKKLIGPDRISFREEFCVYFVSPKLFIVEITNYGFNFPFVDCFHTVTQYRFNTNYKYNPTEGIFKFNTTCTVMFQIVFTKSCLFKGTIEDEGYKESFENLKFKTFERITEVLESQGKIFMEMFEKLNEENMIKTKNTLTSENNNFFNTEKSEEKIIQEDKMSEISSSCDDKEINIEYTEKNQIKLQEKVLDNNTIEILKISKLSYGSIILIGVLILCISLIILRVGV
jgi:uncharacterized cysteine cluster protein YcgN (CxxCxxCC family)